MIREREKKGNKNRKKIYAVHYCVRFGVSAAGIDVLGGADIIKLDVHLDEGAL